jgi:hypothetical protein
LSQAAQYAQSLNLTEISLLFFIDVLDAENRAKYEVQYQDETGGVTVLPHFIETGNP